MKRPDLDSLEAMANAVLELVSYARGLEAGEAGPDLIDFSDLDAGPEADALAEAERFGARRAPIGQMDFGSLTTAQEKLLAALLAETSIAAAAKKVGMSERHAYRLLKQPGFREVYRTARREAMAQAVLRLATESRN